MAFEDRLGICRIDAGTVVIDDDAHGTIRIGVFVVVTLPSIDVDKLAFSDYPLVSKIISGVALLGYVLFESFKLPREARDRMFAILFLIALNPLFWGLFEQAGGSMNLFTDRFVDRGGVPAAIFQSINPIYIIMLAPLFASLWVWLGSKGKEPSDHAPVVLELQGL